MRINEKAKIASRRLIENAVAEAPEGFARLKGATTAPVGYAWYSNGKSRFSGGRVTVLVRDPGAD